MVLFKFNSLFRRNNFLIVQCKLFTDLASENVVNSPNKSLLKANINDTKVLKVAIIGMPNAGKSTFINGLMDRKVCATSPKVHTTRSKAKAIFTREDSQIIFIDTPGLINDREQKKFNLEKKFIKDGKGGSQEADLIGVIHDVTNFWTRDRIDIKIINILEKFNQKPSFLVLNKVDKLKSKRKLLELTKSVTENSIDGKPIEPTKTLEKENTNNRGWPYFSDIFMVSALTGDGLENIRDYLLTKAQPGPWLFSEEVWTDQNAESIIINTVKATLLNFMPHEVPYRLIPVIEYFNVDDNGKIITVVTVKCPSSRISKLLTGNSGSRLRNITESVQKDLQDCFQRFVKIQIVTSPGSEEND